jgi:hypothetical protein
MGTKNYNDSINKPISENKTVSSFLIHNFIIVFLNLTNISNWIRSSKITQENESFW